MADSDVDLRESSFIAFPPAEMEGESGEFTGNSAHVRARARYAAVVLSHHLKRDLYSLCKSLIPV